MKTNVHSGQADRKRVMLASIAGFAILSFAILGVIAYSVHSVTRNANALDNERSRSTVVAALDAVASKLEGVTRDNAVWDDAAAAAYETGDVQWFVDNWGSITKDYPLYNEALVVESDGTPVMAYVDGEEMAMSPDRFYGPSFRVLLAKAQASPSNGDAANVETAFTRTPKGLSVMSIGPILPSTDGATGVPADRRYLVLSHPIGAGDVAALGESYVVPGLAFSAEPVGGLMASPVRDATGTLIGNMVWPAQSPGNRSFHAVLPALGAAFALFAALFAGFAALSRYLSASLRRDRIEAEHSSTHDSLSGLLNRTGLFEQLDRALADGVGPPTLIYLDLDGFKDVNDSYGHAVGDSLIRVVAAKMRGLTGGGATVARLGGDEFAFLAPRSADGFTVADLAAAVHAAFADPFDIDGRTIVIGASIGVATCDTPGVGAAELLRRADLAMYRAKDMGRGRTVHYEAGFDEDRLAQLQMESDLRETIAANDLSVAFQPLVDARTSQWHGVEALARWRNKRLDRDIGPDVFIALAERSGLIELLGLQILRKALVEARKWPGLKVSVNVSPAQFRNPAFPEQVARILRETGADPTLLTLEITEGFFVRNPERAQRIVKALKASGISIALDDFGSGYSSIGYLRQFEFDRLKIDRSFVSSLDREANAPGVIQATVALANAFDIPVTAEGVEREEQAAILRLSGCDEFQGYLFGRPMLAADIDRILAVAAAEKPASAA